MITGGRVAIASVLALLMVVLTGSQAASAAPAASVTVELSPSSIVADGSATASVTGVVTDSNGKPIGGEKVLLSVPADKGITFSPSPTVVTAPNGTYSSTLTGSSTPEQVTVTAVDGAAVVHPAVLTQLAASTTSLVAADDGPLTSTNPLVTNQAVTLVSTVTTTAAAPPAGTVEFENGGTPISGCGAVQIPAGSAASSTVGCSAAFAAPSSPVRLTAIFNPAPGALMLGSASPPTALSIVKDTTSTTVTTADSTPNVDSPVTFTALVTPGDAGPLTPTGDVTFADAGRVIRSCSGQPVAGSSTATCTVRYRTTGRHPITASYGGDDSFNGSSSPATAIRLQPLGTITATMQWQFYYTPSYTRVLQLIVNGASPGATVALRCHGRGCPFAKRNVAVRQTNRCRSSGRRRCATPETIDLTSRFGDRGLLAGSRITVEILKPGWVAKDYVFAVRAGRKPGVRIGCTGPGRTAIGAGC